MIKTGDRYSSNDLTMAKYKDVSFMQADAKIEKEYYDSEDGARYVTIFKGRIMFFEFPKKFNFKLELIGRRFFPYLIPKQEKGGRRMDRIRTESGEFNNHFKIYGEDGVEAFYILDPAFMVKILDISKRHKNKALFGFYDNVLFIALNDGNDSFEPPRPNSRIEEQKEHSKVFSEIKVITDFVDQLSLDRKLFK
jgi:hypothetical protein